MLEREREDQPAVALALPRGADAVADVAALLAQIALSSWRMLTSPMNSSPSTSQRSENGTFGDDLAARAGGSCRTER